MMKKARILIALMALLVAASAVAQDSYREAVKQYLALNDQMEKSKLTVLPFRYMFDMNGDVDIEQLTQRYIDEQMEKDLVKNTCTQLQTLGLTEGDIKEVVSLLSTPQGKEYYAHEKEWQADFLGGFFGAFFDMAEQSDGLDYPKLEPVEPEPGMEAEYVDKFNELIDKTGFLEQIMNSFNDRLFAGSEDKGPVDDILAQDFADWLNKSMYSIMLNAASGSLTTQDLEYADMLYSKDSYRKLNDITNALDNDDFKPGKLMGQYVEWMMEQGATLTSDPSAAGEDFLKSLLEGIGSEE